MGLNLYCPFNLNSAVVCVDALRLSQKNSIISRHFSVLTSIKQRNKASPTVFKDLKLMKKKK